MIFVALTNILLITSLISLLSNSLSKVCKAHFFPHRLYSIYTALVAHSVNDWPWGLVTDLVSTRYSPQRRSWCSTASTRPCAVARLGERKPSTPRRLHSRWTFWWWQTLHCNALHGTIPQQDTFANPCPLQVLDHAREEYLFMYVLALAVGHGPWCRLC